MTVSESIGPYDSRYWCQEGDDFGVFKVYGRASRQCSTQHANITLVQVDLYGSPSCGGEVIAMETLAMDVCLPMWTGSFKLSKGESSSPGVVSSIVYMTYSDWGCSSNRTSTTSIYISSSGSGSDGTAICTTAGPPGNTNANGMKFYVVNEPAAPPPDAVIELVYPWSVSNASCASGNDDSIMLRYLRPNQCLLGNNNQYEKLICGSDPSKYHIYDAVASLIDECSIGIYWYNILCIC